MFSGLFSTFVLWFAMCYYVNLDRAMKQFALRFGASEVPDDEFVPNLEVSGFAHPKIPVIRGNEPTKIELIEWGLIPSWAKDTSFQRNTLNAQFETMREKPSFKDYTANRCLILAHGFYEWQWLDEKGKRKQKYLITHRDNDLMAMAGLWAPWRNPLTGEEKITCTILTTAANELMAEIHNTKKRMPVVLAPENEQKWLWRQKMEQNPYDLAAQKINEDPQSDLFGGD